MDYINNVEKLIDWLVNNALSDKPYSSDDKPPDLSAEVTILSFFVNQNGEFGDKTGDAGAAVLRVMSFVIYARLHSEDELPGRIVSLYQELMAHIDGRRIVSKFHFLTLALRQADLLQSVELIMEGKVTRVRSNSLFEKAYGFSIDVNLV